MKVALYHPWIYLKGGLERTIFEIARQSRHDWTIYTSHFDRAGTYPEFADLDVREVGRVSVHRSYSVVLDASLRIATTKLDLDDADALLVCCDGVGSFITLRNRRVPLLNLCFTPLRAVYDMEYRARHLGRQGWKRVAALFIEKAYKTVDRWLWRAYDQTICISRTVQERAAAGALPMPSSTKVIYPGVHARDARASERFEDFVFIPGRIMWTKNIQLGLQAFLQYRKRTGARTRLVIAGMVDGKSRDYLDFLRDLAEESRGADNGVEFHLSPSDAEMRSYYDRCSVMLFTAFNEELGLTPMEAMASGKPVIAVNKGGPSEVVEHQVTGYLVHADPNSFEVALELLLSNPARMRSMGAAGLERVRRFGWDRFVSELDAALDELVATSRPSGRGGSTRSARGPART